MPTNGNTPILDLQYNVDYDIEILEYKTGENNYGPWHFYQLRYNGEKYGHFAQPVLHEKLSRYNLMAHSSSKTTTVYTHPNLELARDYINKLPNYSIGKKQNQNVTKT